MAVSYTHLDVYKRQAQKIMYNVVMMVAIVCAAMLGAGIVGVIKGTDFLKVGQYGESSRYISLVLTPVSYTHLG